MKKIKILGVICIGLYGIFQILLLIRYPIDLFNPYSQGLTQIFFIYTEEGIIINWESNFYLLSMLIFLIIGFYLFKKSGKLKNGKYRKFNH